MWRSLAYRRQSQPTRKRTRRDHGEPNQGAPARVLPRLVEDAGCLRSGRWLRTWLGGRRPVGVGHRVRRDPFPADCPAPRTEENEMDLSGAGRCEWPANMRAAAFITAVWLASVVINLHPALHGAHDSVVTWRRRSPLGTGSNLPAQPTSQPRRPHPGCSTRSSTSRDSTEQVSTISRTSIKHQPIPFRQGSTELGHQCGGPRGARTHNPRIKWVQHRGHYGLYLHHGGRPPTSGHRCSRSTERKSRPHMRPMRRPRLLRIVARATRQISSQAAA